MRSNTQGTSIDSPADRAFAFVADPGNLPRWAIGFAKEIERDGEGWLVTTGRGQVPLRVAADARLGVVDFHMTVAEGVNAVAHPRVLPRGDGAEYVFTQFQAPSMADEVFDGRVEALGHELVALEALLEGHMHPVNQTARSGASSPRRRRHPPRPDAARGPVTERPSLGSLMVWAATRAGRLRPRRGPSR